MLVIYSLVCLFCSTCLQVVNVVGSGTTLSYVVVSGILGVSGLHYAFHDGFWYISSLRYLFKLGSVAISSSWWGDYLSGIIFVVVMYVSFFVVYFSLSYLLSDKDNSVYMVRLQLFVCGMSMLVLCNQLLMVFLSWEVIGLTSFALIGFWYSRKEGVNGSLKAIVLNRVGDLSFVFSLCLCYNILGCGSLSLLCAYSTWVTSWWVTWFVCFLVFAGVVKSAQIWVHLWLVDAMEAPTPTSALLHAATMVIAGVYLVIRIHSLIIVTSPLVSYIVVSILTMLFACLVALSHTDLKKIVAYSTSSHIAYMFLGSFCSVNSFYNSSLYHLLSHACFKSLLFISSGLVIHSLGHIQDIRSLSVVQSMFPYLSIAIFLSTFPILPIPFLSSFYSKHYILFNLISYSPILLCGLVFFFLGTLLSIVYTVRLIYFLCLSRNKVTWPMYVVK